MSIRVLPPQVTAQIAAGEVIERPASIVKELIENALDADATRIAVVIEQSGTRSIKVEDNGTGIPADQEELAFIRHATSKLRDEADLLDVGTLGFRGEALPAIAAISDLNCISRTADGNPARYQINYGQPTGPPQPTVAPVGTRIMAERLFVTQQARLNYMRTRNTEAPHIQRVTARYAMAYPHVSFEYFEDREFIFHTDGNSRLQDAIRSILGPDVATQLLPVWLQSNDIQVSGYVGNPDLHRSNRDGIALTVNGRCVQDNDLAYAIEQEYRNSLPRGRRPVAVIHLQVPSDLVDVNALPTKQEVRFRDPSLIFAAVRQAVRETLSAPGGCHETGLHPFADFTTPPPAIALPQQERDRALPTTPQIAPETHRPDYQRSSALTRHGAHDTDGLPPERNLREVIPQLQIIGQTQRTFILADGPDGVYVLDQHAAHERIIFDRLIQQRSCQPAITQPLLVPEHAALDQFQQQTLTEHLDLITEQGFTLQQIGDLQWEISAVPLPLTTPHCPGPDQALQRLLDEFTAEQLVSSPQQAIAATIACHAATRAGDTLHTDAMQAIIEQLGATPEPHQCPHGRPTIVQIPTARLEQEFRRR